MRATPGIVLLFTGAAVLSLAACGQKGPLYLPEEAQSVVTRGPTEAQQPPATPQAPQQDPDDERPKTPPR